MHKKVCAKCGQEKPIEDFHRRAASPDGHGAQCKPCNIATAVAGKKKARREVPGRVPGQRWKIGDSFGDLTVTSITRPMRGNPNALLTCLCSCGGTRDIWANQVQVAKEWTCRDRKSHPLPPRKEPAKVPCPECGAPMSHKAQTCNPCSWKRMQTRSDDDPRVVRSQRVQQAPGLRAKQRAALLHKWQAQHRMCTYCGVREADTVDHVIPLVRGGDNYEGNLTPCCHACNTMKSGNLLSAWRLKIKLGQQQQPAEWQWRPKPPPKKRTPKKIKAITGEQQVMINKVCPACGAGYPGEAAYCSPRCAARSAYRLKVGIPITKPVGRR